MPAIICPNCDRPLMRDERLVILPVISNKFVVQHMYVAVYGLRPLDSCEQGNYDKLSIN